MKILYGVVGEGMGHAMRSSVVLEKLTHSHQVQVVASGRARDYLSQRFANVRGIWGLEIEQSENQGARHSVPEQSEADGVVVGAGALLAVGSATPFLFLNDVTHLLGYERMPTISTFRNTIQNLGYVVHSRQICRFPELLQRMGRILQYSTSIILNPVQLDNLEASLRRGSFLGTLIKS